MIQNSLVSEKGREFFLSEQCFHAFSTLPINRKERKRKEREKNEPPRRPHIAVLGDADVTICT